ncbi:GerMN domain-containing protein [Patescibacteria group bacterium]|nr:GerMN domain-containing protein [Patescibacteria group bacterium]
MNKAIIIVVVLVVVLTATLFLFARTEQTKIREGLVILSPLGNEEVSSPFIARGYVNGNGWIGFEGQVGTASLVLDGQVLTQTPLVAKGEWMTAGPINFEAVLDFQIAGTKDAVLLFRNEDPSGGFPKEFSLPIKLKGIQGETSVVSVYFLNEQDDCQPSSFVSRIIPKTQAVARSALEELLKGPTLSEKRMGFSTSINELVEIQDLTIENGTAKVDFSDELEVAGGSCRVSAVRGQIVKTLEQFPSVSQVIISINGETETILQP